MSRRKHSARALSDSKVKNLISYFFAFLLSLVFLGMTAVLVLRLGVMSERGFRANFNDSYIQSVMDMVRTQTEYYTAPTGIDPSVLDGIFTEDEIAGDVDGMVSAAFKGTEYAPDLTAQNARMDKNLRSFFADNHIIPESGTLDDVISEFQRDIDEIYTETIRLPGLDSIARVRRLYLRYDLAVLGVLAILAVILIIVSLKLHHYFHRSLRYIAYAAGAAALMSFVVPCMLYGSRFYVGLNLQPKYFYDFAVSLIQRLLGGCMMAGVIWLVITIVLAFIIMLRRRALTRY